MNKEKVRYCKRLIEKGHTVLHLVMPYAEWRQTPCSIRKYVPTGKVVTTDNAFPFVIKQHREGSQILIAVLIHDRERKSPVRA